MNEKTPTTDTSVSPQKTRPVGLDGVFGPNDGETQAFTALMQSMGWNFHQDLQTGEFILVQGSNWDKVCRSKSRSKKGAIRALLEEALLEHTIMFDPLKKAALIRGPLQRGYDENAAQHADVEEKSKKSNTGKKKIAINKNTGGSGLDKATHTAEPTNETEPDTKSDETFELAEEDFLAEKSDPAAFDAMPSEMKSAIRRAHKAGLTIRIDGQVLYIAKISREMNDIARQQAAKVNTLMKVVNLQDANERQLKMLAAELNKLCVMIEAMQQLDRVVEQENGPDIQEPDPVVTQPVEDAQEAVETEAPSTTDDSASDTDQAEIEAEPVAEPETDDTTPPPVAQPSANDSELDAEQQESEPTPEDTDLEGDEQPETDETALPQEDEQPSAPSDEATEIDEEPSPEAEDLEEDVSQEELVEEEPSEETPTEEEPAPVDDETAPEQPVEPEVEPETEPEPEAAPAEDIPRETPETTLKPEPEPMVVEEEPPLPSEPNDIISADDAAINDTVETQENTQRAKELDEVLQDVKDFEVPSEAHYSPSADDAENQLVLGDDYAPSQQHITTRAAAAAAKTEEKSTLQHSMPQPPAAPTLPHARVKPKSNVPTAAERYEETHQFEEAVEREDLDEKMKKELRKAKQAGYEAKIIGPNNDPDAERRLVVYKDEKDANGRPVSRAIFTQKFDDLEEPSELERGLARLRQAINTDPEKSDEEKAEESSLFEQRSLSDMELFNPDEKPKDETEEKDDDVKPDEDKDTEEDDKDKKDLFGSKEPEDDGKDRDRKDIIEDIDLHK